VFQRLMCLIWGECMWHIRSSCHLCKVYNSWYGNITISAISAILLNLPSIMFAFKSKTHMFVIHTVVLIQPFEIKLNITSNNYLGLLLMLYIQEVNIKAIP